MNMNTKENKSNSPFIISLKIGEDELYEDEIKDLILEIINKEIRMMSSDRNQTECRKYHILHSILENNKISGNGKKISFQLKKIMSNIDILNTKCRKQLKQLGFSIYDDGKHHKLYFHDDKRYLVVLAKTASDCRSYKNAAAAACRMLSLVNV